MGKSESPDLIYDDSAIDQLLSPYRHAVEQALKHIKEEGNSLSEVTYDYLSSGGKKLRSSVSLLACEAVSGSFRQAIPIAISYELAHSASLTQDDIIDDSATRHNKPTAHTRHGVTTAILISDMILFEIFDQLAEYVGKDSSPRRSASLIRLVARAAKETGEGEFLEMQLSKKPDPSVDDYIGLAGLKTGALFGAAAASGGVVGGGKPRTVKGLYEYGRNLGIAFQIVDDVLDVTGRTEEMGKPMFKDLQNNTSNIVLIHALSHGDHVKKSAIRTMMAKSAYGVVDAEGLQGILDDLGSVEYASDQCAKHASIARTNLSALPVSESKRTLEKLTYWLEQRRR